MPIYEYRCTKCNHSLEALQKMSDAPLRKCPACGKSALEKLVSAASFRLKGGGWYETDFKTGDKKQLADSDSAGGNGGKSDDSDAKTAAAGKNESGKADSGKSAEKSNKEPAKASGNKGAEKSADKPAKSSAKKAAD